ncbi:MAG: iron ABC transporter permease [Candidatus Eremiobacteraeota bacterium]|nr:iron ABC transporter permease [Candidatus Eremiobacteraeota bacterium]
MLVLLAPPLVAALTPSGLAGAPAPGWRELVLLARSLALAGLTTALSLGVGVACAWALAHHNLPGRAFFKTVLLVPFLLPPYLSAIAWTGLVDLSGSLPAAALVLAASHFPLVMFPILAGLERLGGGLEEAGWIALGPGRTWRRVVWPLVLPFALGGAALVWMLTLVEYGVPSLLGVDTFALEVFALIQGYHDYGAAGRACLPLLAIGLLPGLLVLAWGYPRMRRLTVPQTSRPARRLLWPRWPALALVSLVTLASLAVPLYSLVAQAHRPGVFNLALWEAGSDLLSSLWIAGLATALALALGALVGLGGGTGWAGTALLSLTVPPSLAALGLVAIHSQLGLGSSNLWLVWGLATRLLALPACLLALSAEATPPSQLAAARLVLPPLRLGGLWLGLHQKAWQTALWLTFALAMGDLSLSLLLAEPGTSTLSLRIFNLYHYGRPDLVGALCLVLVGVVVTPLAVGLCLEKSR